MNRLNNISSQPKLLRTLGNSTNVSKILALLLVSVFAVSGVAGLLGVIPIAHAQVTCTNTYSASNPPPQQWTISSSGTYCLEAGTYNTQITITASNVILTGSPGTTPSQVVIQPSASTLTINVENDPQLTWGSGYGEAIIYADGGSSGISGVTVEGLTVDGLVASSDLNTCGGGTLIGNAGWYIGILLSGVSGTISDSTAENILQASPSLYGCQQDATFGVFADTGTAPSATVTISQNTITNYAKGGIVCLSIISGLTCDVSDNTLSTNVGTEADTNGIQLGPNAVGSVTGNLITGNVYSGSNSPGCDLIYDNQGVGILTYDNTGPITISGNSLVGDDVGIYLYGDTGAITPTSNSLTGNTCVGIAVYDESQTVSGNAFSSEPVGIEAVSDASSSPATVTVGGNTFSSSVTTPTTTETAYEGTAEIISMIPPFVGCTTTYDPTSNVPFQQLNVTEPGSYCFNAGTYDTQITITTSNVTLETTPGAMPIAIIEPTTPTANAWAYSFGSPTSEIAIIAATPSTSGSTFSALTTSITGVTVKNLDVEGTSVSTDIGIYFQNVMSGTISGNVVNNIYPDGYADGAQAGLGILVQSSGASTAASSSVTISNNVVTNYNKNGITCEQAYEGGSDGTTACYVTSNTVTFPMSAQPLIASNGIEFYGTTADSTIIGNTVSGNACTDYNPSDPATGECGPEGYTSSGILTSATSGVTISGNTVTGSDIGVYMYGDTGPVDVASNTVSGSTYTGVLAYDESSTVTISGNTISGAECSNISPNANWGGPDSIFDIYTTYTCGPGLITQYQDQGIETYGNSGPITISGNILSSNDVGIYSYGDTSTVTSMSNSITGSTYVGLAVYDESQTVSGNAFSSEPVGIEAVSDTLGVTAIATVGGNTFLDVVSPTTTETANGGVAEIIGVTSGTAVTCIPASFAIGSTSRCTATVTGSIPTGTVTFTQSGTGSVTLPISPTCNLVSGGPSYSSCYITIKGATAGTFTITATYPGDPNNAGSSGSTATLTVLKLSTTTTVSCTPASFTIGSTTQCTAYVSGGLSPTGTVTFTQSGTGSVTLPISPTCNLVSGSCHITVTGATVGSFTITATYGGDSSNAGSYATTSQLTVNKATTTTSLNCGGAVTFGNTATCTATVSGEYGSINSETISFAASGVGVFSSPTCTLIGVMCSVTYTPANTGTQTITAAYPGDSNNLGSSGVAELAVNPVLAPPTTISCNPSPVLVGRYTTCKVIVLGSPTPTGTVTWSGASNLGSFSTSTCKLRYGSCGVVFSTTSAGEATITATYSGNHPTSSNTFNLVVSQATSRTAISCSRRTVALGSTTTCAAVVTGYHPTGTVTWSATAFGSVSFASNLNTCQLTGGRCSVTMTAEGAGEVVIYATYGGDSNNLASSRTSTLVVPRDKTTLSVSCTPSSEAVGSSIMTCTATLHGYFGSVSGETVTWSQTGGTGRVSFSSSTCTLSSGATCSVTVTGVSKGGVRIEAVYSGDTNNANSQLTIAVKIT